ncbi:MAG: hypothetical protein COW01_11555 [Bdellovibrionales bacterium CG12_big_fil_rev_8_21_14_0_65_38_15]|nr:MAG: hypothetical protein COW79_11585 [Bdellovibrionales bacterium CG22_combo_CG10-13_8_21_14_all_38_13]PIQ54247.1 MAG: hypothetical protein COW01_11555 [Bdellovibrionales bacterium CG12_big_fil_rev_8_21_14_0_65_38_15]PIR29303.1 MAG: hypothetical protein COV38_11200 [Bdellovibrionales bacterium CG11_big_fil_rev_8_21_14_0_20_38_13]
MNTHCQDLKNIQKLNILAMMDRVSIFYSVLKLSHLLRLNWKYIITKILHAQLKDLVTKTFAAHTQTHKLWPLTDI